MKNEKTQDEWLTLAREAADTIFAKQQELFNELTGVVYYCVEVTRFDTFVKVDATVSPKDYMPENFKAKKIDLFLKRVSEGIYLSEYTTMEEFENFVPTVIGKMEGYAESAKNIINE